MSDNKTPISSILGIIESRNEFLKRLHFEADEHDKKFIKPRIEENERTLETLKSHLAVEEEAIRGSKKLMHQLLSLIDKSYQRKAEKMIDEHFSKFKPE